jgi:hypothetical protein
VTEMVGGPEIHLEGVFFASSAASARIGSGREFAETLLRNEPRLRRRRKILNGPDEEPLAAIDGRRWWAMGRTCSHGGGQWFESTSAHQFKLVRTKHLQS